MLIRNVIFDFGGVLVRWKPQEIIDGFYNDVRLRTRVRQAVFQHPDWIEMDRGFLEEEAAAERFAVRMQRPAEEMRALLQITRHSLTPIEQSVALARELKERGMSLYGLSNMPSYTFAYLRERYDHWDVFQGIVISGDVKLIKPDPAIFRHILQQYRLDPTQSVFIDDHSPNIEAARQLGFHTVLFQDAQQCGQELEALFAGMSSARGPTTP